MIPSKDIRRTRHKLYEYIDPLYDYDTSITSDLPNHITFPVSEFHMAFPTSITRFALPKDTPDHLFIDINICEVDLENAMLCQLKKRFDKFCQREMIQFLRCRERRDKAVIRRVLEFEKWKIKEKKEDVNLRLEEIKEKEMILQRKMEKVIKTNEFLKQKEIQNDLDFLLKRKENIKINLF